MAKRTKTGRAKVLDWHFSREDEAWEVPVATPDGMPSSASVYRRGAKAILVSLLVMAVAVALYVWREAEVGAQALEEELRATIALEGQTPLPPDNDKASREEFTFHRDFVSIQVNQIYTESFGYTSTLHQRHFYQRADDNWVGVPATSIYLGERESLETEFFIFEYYKLDAEAVRDVAAQLDAIYTNIRQDYALPAPEDRIRITLLTDPSETRPTCNLSNHLCINSPALAALPIRFSESEVLQLRILSALVNQTRWKALEAQPVEDSWHNTMIALSLVQLRRHSSVISAWHTDLTRWLDGRAPRMTAPDEEMLAQELARLCNLHQLRSLGHLYTSAVPVHFCARSLRIDFPLIGRSNPPEHLGELLEPYPDRSEPTQLWLTVFACASLLDYLAATYGAEILPAMVEGFRHYDSWETLAPALLGVSAQEVERGWKEYRANPDRENLGASQQLPND